MAIPDFQSLMLPLLQFASNGEEHSVAHVRTPLADQFRLTDEERKELLPSGQHARFNNRLAWAKVYLERAGLLQKTRRGHFKITPRGGVVLDDPPERIDCPFLTQFPEFEDFRSKSTAGPVEVTSPAETPEETIDAAYEQINRDLGAELLQQIASAPPLFFERLVLNLMLKMGYGGSGESVASLTAPGADGGIDGVINEDRLGLDVIYLQAKRWRSIVGRPEIQKFVGALHGKRAKKGVFLTTSNFSHDAIEYAETIDPKVVLIDGTRLARLMIECNVGVSRSHTYEMKRIDTDYFTDE